MSNQKGKSWCSLQHIVITRAATALLENCNLCVKSTLSIYFTTTRPVIFNQHPFLFKSSQPSPILWLQQPVAAGRRLAVYEVYVSFNELNLKINTCAIDASQFALISVIQNFISVVSLYVVDIFYLIYNCMYEHENEVS